MKWERQQCFNTVKIVHLRKKTFVPFSIENEFGDKIGIRLDYARINFVPN
jgi:hypothetical protein